MAIMVHATDSTNLPSIRKRGLLASRSRQKRKAVWFVRPSQESWAVRHAVNRCQGRVEDICVLTVDVPDEWLTHHGEGLFYVSRNVPANRIVGLKRCRMEVVKW